MNWRDSKLFMYGWLPVRVLAFVIAAVLIGLLYLAVLVMWLDPEQAMQHAKGAYYE